VAVGGHTQIVDHIVSGDVGFSFSLFFFIKKKRGVGGGNRKTHANRTRQFAHTETRADCASRFFDNIKIINRFKIEYLSCVSSLLFILLTVDKEAVLFRWLERSARRAESRVGALDAERIFDRNPHALKRFA